MHSKTPILEEENSKTLFQSMYFATQFSIYKSIIEYLFCNKLVNLECVHTYSTKNQKIMYYRISVP